MRVYYLPWTFFSRGSFLDHRSVSLFPCFTAFSFSQTGKMSCHTLLFPPKKTHTEQPHTQAAQGPPSNEHRSAFWVFCACAASLPCGVAYCSTPLLIKTENIIVVFRLWRQTVDPRLFYVLVRLVVMITYEHGSPPCIHDGPVLCLWLQ